MTVYVDDLMLLKRVVHCKRSPFDVYIGRPSKWGNPFKIGPDGNRAEVIAKYERWLWSQPNLIRDLKELDGKTLGCYCAPQPCHGLVLLKVRMKMADLAQTSSALLAPIVNNHMKSWYGCEKCDRHIFCGCYVFYRGHVPAPVLFIGEAPGNSENILGRPFVGPAGNKLDEIISLSLPAKMKYAITNTVCCAPFSNEGQLRPPMFTEKMNCFPRLSEFAKICNPKLIVGVGNPGFDAAQGLANTILPHAKTVQIKHPSWIISYADDPILETRRAQVIVKEATSGL